MAVHAVVRTHYRSRLADLVGDLECEQVGLTRGLFADLVINVVAVRLLPVERVMLHRRDDVLRLDPLDLVPGDDSGQQWILAAIFEIATVSCLTRKIHPARELHVEARQERLPADHRAACLCELGVPGRRGRDARRQRGAQARRRSALAGDADAGIGLPLVGDAEPRDAGHDPRGGGQPVLGIDPVLDRRLQPVGVGREVTEGQLQLLVERHRLQQQLDAGVRAECSIHPRPRLRHLGPRGRCTRRVVGRLRGGGRYGHDTHRDRSRKETGENGLGARCDHETLSSGLTCTRDTVCRARRLVLSSCRGRHNGLQSHRFGISSLI